MALAGSILSITIFFIGYSLLHSWLASRRVKNWLRQRLGQSYQRWYRLFYNVVATVTLLPLLAMLAWLPDRTLYIVPSPWRWLMVAGQLLAVAAAGWTLLQTGLFHFLGLAQLVGQPEQEPTDLNLSGFYRWVRHPLYTFSLLFLWLTPAMTVNLLTTYSLFTLYFYLGSIHEERRLVAEFGAAYERYRRQVPRLMPWPGQRYEPSQE